MKKQFATIFICLSSSFFAVAEPKSIPTGPYVLTSIRLSQEGEPILHHLKTDSAYIAESDGEYTISIRYGRAGIIKLPLHINGEHVSFFVIPSAGSVDGKDLFPKGFFGKRSADSIEGLSTSGNRNWDAFKLEPFQAVEPESKANKAE